MPTRRKPKEIEVFKQYGTIEDHSRTVCEFYQGTKCTFAGKCNAKSRSYKGIANCDANGCSACALFDTPLITSEPKCDNGPLAKVFGTQRTIEG